MFRSERMRKITIYALNKDRYKVISKLHELGALQIEDLKNTELKNVLASAPSETIKKVSDQLLRVSRLYHIQKLAPEKVTFVQNMFGLDLPSSVNIPDRHSSAIIKDTESFLEKNEQKLANLEDTHTRALENLEEQKKLRQIIDIFAKYDFNPALIHDTENTNVTAGRMQTLLLPKLEEELKAETNEHYSLLSRTETSKSSIVVLINLKEHAAKTNFLLKKFNVSAFNIMDLPEVTDVKKWIESEIEKSIKTSQEAIKEIGNIRKELFKQTVLLREELEILKERYEAEHKMLNSESFFVIQGWVPKSKVIMLKTELRNSIDDTIIIQSAFPEENDTPPVKLTNPKWLNPSEMITELYSLPTYRDLDPTFIVGPIFLVFAGFMLTDFFYGLGLVLLGGVLVKKFGKYSIGLKHLATNMFWIGIFSMIFGVLTGSYFGDLPKYLFGMETAQLAIWKDPLAEPLYFLIISLSVAVLHLNIGLVLGSIEDIRKGQWKTFVSERVVWFCMQFTVLLIYLHSADIISSNIPAYIFAGITLLIVIVSHGLLGILGMTGFMGDVISYSRLFALALSTAGIAMTVNLLADLMTGIPYVGFVLAIIILIAGHLFSFLMNSLGAFVHSIRLQFVEFFGKFYDGGGDKYEPFKEERYYTKIE